MNLELFNNLMKDIKENNVIQDFINEISNYLQEKGKNKLEGPNNEIGGLREENCLYQVVGFSSNGVFLQNTKSKKISEETNIPKELKAVIGNDFFLRFKDGKYIFEEELTDKFMESMIPINEYKEMKDFKKEE